MDTLRQNILHTADTLFKQYGIKSVSIDDICKQLGMSKKTFYTYYAQKEDLVEAILADARQKGRECMEESLNKYNTEQRILQLQGIIHRLDEVHQAPPLVFDLQKYHPTLLKRHMELLRDDIHRDCERMLQQGIDEGLFRKEIDVTTTADFLTMLHRGMVTMSPDILSNKQIQTGLEIITRGLLTEEGLNILIKARKNNK